jgi:hypothetical protein
VTYDSITNRADYLSAHYLAEILPKTIKEKGGLRTRWAEREKSGQPTPPAELRRIRRTYFDARLSLSEPAEDQDLHDKTMIEQNATLLLSLGYPAEPRNLDVDRSGETFQVPVAYSGQNVVAIDCDWATDADAAFDGEAGGRLLHPVPVENREEITTGAKLARWLFAADEPPRYVLLLHGGVIVLADRLTWGEGRYLASSLDTAIERGDRDELELIAALFSADALQPPAEGGEEQLAKFVAGSRQHAVGVSSELREGLRESVQIIANEILDRLRDQGAKPEEWIDPKTLTRQSLRYLYRILFLLYAEARPELGILPVDDEDYVAGYSMARLGELVARRLGGEEARKSFHLYESLEVLFRMVNDGHRARGGVAVAEDESEGDGLRFEALKADLFLPPSADARLIGTVLHPDDDELVWDTRLRDGALYRVLRRLMLTKGKGRGSGKRGKTERGGFISYAQLGINQLGAVYEGLMSYTGFIAGEELYEVAKKHKQKDEGDPTNGSWMIPTSKVSDYPDDVFVMEKDENGFKTGERVRYHAGSFVYRLAGRDRQTSASYYTPQSLTSVTVQLALEQRVKEQGGTATAAEVLRWRVCEPALGSGAFLNEAIDQLAALYLRLREEETGKKLEPEERALVLQKVKAYIALHNCYGVDLNETAVELAEVSIWLNVMHRGLQAPWFGLHLVRGNSLIGAGRRLYPVDSLKGAWLDSAPVDYPFSAGELLPGHVHHFLLPAKGWGAVAGEKEAKQLAPEDTKRLADWRKQIRKAPSVKRTRGHKLSQVERLQALSKRAEYLWSLVIERLKISEREISRPIDVWGTSDLPKAEEAISRHKIVQDLTTPGTPYWRLKTLMDAWCALWFWPVDKTALLDGSAPEYAKAHTAEPKPAAEPAPRDPDPNFPTAWEMDSLFGDLPKQLTLASAAPKKPRPKPVPVDLTRPVPLSNLDDWLDFAEAVLGRQDVAADSLAGDFTFLKDMEEYEDKLESEFYMNMDSFSRLAERFPWLGTVKNIADTQGFFHWELRFASVFADGGFDLQVGNPPWVRPRWEENTVLAEYEPWFVLADKPSASEQRDRKAEVLSATAARAFFIDELVSQVATNDFFLTPAVYDLLVGTQPDFYRGFMIRTWRNLGPGGTVGLVHPDTHFSGAREGILRAAAYQRLRIHGDFVNAMLRFFADVSHVTHFGIHIYGRPKEIGFAHLSWLTDAEELPNSLAMAENGELPAGWDDASGAPGVRYLGEWDSRPHPARVIHVDLETLDVWQRLTGGDEVPIDQTQLLSPVSAEEQDAMSALASYSTRLGDFDPPIFRGFEESSAKKDGLIKYDLSNPGDWFEVVLKGIQIGLANPIFKSPTANSNDAFGLDLVLMPPDATPETEYRRAAEVSRFNAAQEQWTDPRSGARRRYTEFHRMAWRRQIAPNTERSLFAAIIPPGPTHVHLVHSTVLADDRSTALAAGFWCSLPLDYFVRITGKSDLQTSGAKTIPFGLLDHPLASTLLLRTMRLNCLTNAYADLWAEVYDDAWRAENWACNWEGLPPLSTVGPTWDRDTPLRTERARRSALVEIDVLVAVWLGMDVDALTAIYRAAFPVLNRYENITWFDANGWKLAGYHRTYGQIQQKTTWDEFQTYRDSGGTTPPPAGYTPPFYKANRESEYRQAHAVFTERLRQTR